MTDFKLLFSPIRVGSMELKNRIVVTGHKINFTPERANPKGTSYYEARAKGGAGAVTLEALGVFYTGKTHPDIRYADRLDFFRDQVEAVHAYGAKVIVQATIQGGMWTPSVSSSVPMKWVNTQARQLTTRELKNLSKGFGDTAVALKDLGVDAFEMHLSHGTGLNQIASTLYNYRTDEYGGSLENRMRFFGEVLADVRDKIGNSLAVGARVNVDESRVKGAGLEEGVERCWILTRDGMLDYLSVDTAVEPQEDYLMVPSSYLPQTPMLYAAEAVREAVDIPVLGVGRITTPQVAEAALVNGSLDMVGAVRALIADPEWPNKAQRGDLDQIRYCIGCVEACFGRTVKLKRTPGAIPVEHALCQVNPNIGNERTELLPVKQTKKIVVVGAGVSGMQFAMTATRRGHKVTVLEKESVTGGHINWMSKLPGKADVQDIARWLDVQMKTYDIDLRLGIDACAELVKSMKPDAVVIATGSHFIRSGYSTANMREVEGADSDHVLVPEEVILGRKETGDNVLIYDDTGYIVGAGIAEMLSDAGKRVEVVTSYANLPWAVAHFYLDKVVNTRVMSKATVTRDHVLEKIDGNSIHFSNVYTFDPIVRENVDSLILITGRQPNETLFQELETQVPELHIIGDANISHLGDLAIESATREGEQLARRI